MTLVQNAIQPVEVLEGRDVIAHDLVGGDDHIACIQLLKQSGPFAGAPGVQDRSKVLRVFQDLIIPMPCQRGRADD
jgi:hypothetical protein